MKKMKMLLGGAALALAMTAGSAMATDYPKLEAGYTWVNAPFWSPTDSTTPPAQGNSKFELYFEGYPQNNIKDASFGLFSVADIKNPASPTKFEVFGVADEQTLPLPTSRTVSFRENAGQFQVSLDHTNWTDFGREFGFYFDYVNGNNTDQNASFYTCSALDTGKNNDADLNVLTARNATSEVLIYLDQDGVGEESFRMMIGGDDLAPVPEPGTMMLLGAGFLGLAIYGKRRKNA